MPNLSLIEAEAQRVVGHLPEDRRLVLEAALLELCESHWQELRGPEPTMPLARALWSVTPPCSDLLLDLYVNSDARLAEVLPGQRIEKGLALLVLAEIARGNEAGVHLAHEPMMALEAASAPAAWLQGITVLLRGELAAPPLHAHAHEAPLYKALSVLAAHTSRLDLPAMLEVIRLLVAPAGSDAVLEQLRADVLDTGIGFLGADEEYVHFTQHGHEHKPVRTRQLAEMMFKIRQHWLG